MVEIFIVGFTFIDSSEKYTCTHVAKGLLDEEVVIFRRKLIMLLFQ